MKKPKFIYEEWHEKYGFQNSWNNATKMEWMRTERERWENGFMGLTGAHYFHLTQCKIKNAYGKTIRPLWRDVDEEIFGAWHACKEKGWDLLVLKRREIGLTTIFGGTIPMYSAIIHPGSVNLLTSADKGRMEEMYDNKTKVIYENLDPAIKPQVKYDRSWGFMHLAKPEGGGLDSKIIARETVERPKNLEAYRAMSVFLDEFFLHPKADQVHRSAQATVKSSGRKVAPIVMGGSAGESSVEGQKAGSKLWENADILRIVTLFLPATKGIMEAPELDADGNETGNFINFCPNGYSDEKAAEEWILKEREKLDKLEDKTYIESFIKQYPLTIQEVFSANAKGALPEDVINKLITQERVIITTRPQIERVNLSRDPFSKEVKITPDQRGDVRILIRPEEGHRYIAGIDPIPYNSKNLGDGSEEAIVIKDMDTNQYVAWYKKRASDPDIVVDTQIMLLDAYNKAKALIEINRGGVTKEQYRLKQRTELLAYKPVALGKGFSTGEGSFGYYKNDATAEQGNAALIDYLRKYYDTLFFIEFIEEAKNYIVDNTDLIDAVVACELQHKNIITLHKANEKKVKGAKRTIPILIKDGNGRMIWSHKEIIDYSEV